MNANQWELGTPDFFIGRIFDETGLKWTETNTWSCNGGDFVNRKEQAIGPIKSGIWFLHGTKTLDELNWCLAQKT